MQSSSCLKNYNLSNDTFTGQLKMFGSAQITESLHWFTSCVIHVHGTLWYHNYMCKCIYHNPILLLALFMCEFSFSVSHCAICICIYKSGVIHATASIKAPIFQTESSCGIVVMHYLKTGSLLGKPSYIIRCA